jgi:hypothetical protein
MTVDSALALNANVSLFMGSGNAQGAIDVFVKTLAKPS